MKKLNKISSRVIGPVEKALRVYFDSRKKIIKKKEVFQEDFDFGDETIGPGRRIKRD